jgi:hypothetical protein
MELLDACPSEDLGVRSGPAERLGNNDRRCATQLETPALTPVNPLLELGMRRHVRYAKLADGAKKKHKRDPLVQE